MPPSRTLAASLGISRNTAVAAYELLLGEGYLIARQGAGTYVARVLSDAAARSNSAPSAGGPHGWPTIVSVVRGRMSKMTAAFDAAV